jgi:hypothetical protein
MGNKVTILFENVFWSPYHSIRGYASGRMHTIHFKTRNECDDWIERQIVDEGYYTAIPLIHPSTVAQGKIISIEGE